MYAIRCWSHRNCMSFVVHPTTQMFLPSFLAPLFILQSFLSILSSVSSYACAVANCHLRLIMIQRLILTLQHKEAHKEWQQQWLRLVCRGSDLRYRLAAFWYLAFLQDIPLLIELYYSSNKFFLCVYLSNCFIYHLFLTFSFCTFCLHALVGVQ